MTSSGSKPSRRAAPRPRYDPVSFSELDGVRYLHFGSEWVQGAMRVARPFKLELEYTRQMMVWELLRAKDQVQQVLQLGLGAGSLTKYVWREMPQAHVTVVELNPDVIAAAHGMFRLPFPDDRLSVVQADAGVFVADPSLAGQFDVVQIDVYDAQARGPVLDSVVFYQHVARVLAPDGVVVINLFGDPDNLPRSINNLRKAFDGAVARLPPLPEGNVTAMAWKGALDVSRAELLERVESLQLSAARQARRWASSLLLRDAA